MGYPKDNMNRPSYVPRKKRDFIVLEKSKK